MSTNETTSRSCAPRRVWRKRLLSLGLIAAILLGPSTGYFLFSRWSDERDAREAIAETDQLDPGWRLEDMETARKPVSDAENSAIVLEAAHKLLAKWTRNPALDELYDSPPQFRLRKEIVDALRVEVTAQAAALKEARKLADLRNGRFPLNYAPNLAGLLMSRGDLVRKVGYCLFLDGTLRHQEGDLDGAMSNIRAMVNAGRAEGDEPLIWMKLMLYHVNLNAAVYRLEMTLAQGQPSIEALLETRKVLEDELTETKALYTLRSERAIIHTLLTNVANGSVDLKYVRDNARGWPKEETLRHKVVNRFGDPSLLRSHAWLLRQFNELTKAVKRPRYEWSTRPAKSPSEKAPPLAEELKPLWWRGTRYTASRNQAIMRCAVSALAAEYFQRQHGRWPKSLDELVSNRLIKEVPLDPYDGQPLRYRLPHDGVVIYSIGRFGKYDGTSMDNDRLRPEDGWDYPEFRLWNPDRRGQPPRPIEPMSKIDDRK